MSDDDVLIRADHVSKKFCRSLKRSLWYGAQDVANSLKPWKNGRHRDGNQTDELFQEPILREDEFWALRDVSFEVRRGECLGLIGHNGAGKSTLLKILNSLIRPDAGRITMKGRVCALIELSAGFNPILTGRENIYNQASLLGFRKNEIQEKFDAIVEFAEIGEFLDMPVQNYSSGMRVRLGFAVAAQLEPDILILDEVLAVGDVAFRLKCINAMGRLMQNSAVVFVSHSMPQIVRVCTSALVLRKGAVVYHGNDLGAGIGTYLESDSRLDLPQSFGSGEVAIDSALMRAGDAKISLGQTFSIVHGTRPSFEITLSASSNVKTARLQMLVWNQEMIPVLDVVGDDLEGHIVEFDGTKKLKVSGTLPPLMLNSGRYMVSIHANSEDLRRNYCRLDNAFYIFVDAVSSSGAHILGKASWTDCFPAAKSRDL